VEEVSGSPKGQKEVAKASYNMAMFALYEVAWHKARSAYMDRLASDGGAFVWELYTPLDFILANGGRGTILGKKVRLAVGAFLNFWREPMLPSQTSEVTALMQIVDRLTDEMRGVMLEGSHVGSNEA
jgi:hypothetical protein